MFFWLGQLLIAEVLVRMLRQRLLLLVARGSYQREAVRGVTNQLGNTSLPLRLSSSRATPGQEAVGVVQSLLDTHSQTVSSLISEKLAGKFVLQYRALAEPDRADLLLHLATNHGVPTEKAREVAKRLAGAQLGSEGRLQDEMQAVLVPPHNLIYSKVGALQGGVKFLVDLRADLLACLKQGRSESETLALRKMNSSLQKLLANWFSVGFLQLQRVSWDSPCALLERVAALEAVHPVRDWTDLRTRVGKYRRCFVYTHPSMPGEPVVILHVALTQEVASSVSGLVKNHRQVKGAHGEVWKREEGEVEQPDKIGAAIFYSVTSTQPGLAGIELGTHLIKGAVASLALEFPNLNTFSTLSPIPGFRSWLLLILSKAASSEAEKVLSSKESSLIEAVLGPGNPHALLLSTLKTNSWLSSQDQQIKLQPLLKRLAARYLLLEKRRNAALNPVANFHVRNGSTVWRVNWMADPSPRGMEASLGMMVNYRYYLDRLETNSTAYLNHYTIDADPQVTNLLTDDE